MEDHLHKRDHTGVQDFVLLEDYTNSEAFIENLSKRFYEDIIYVSSKKYKVQWDVFKITP